MMIGVFGGKKENPGVYLCPLPPSCSSRCRFGGDEESLDKASIVHTHICLPSSVDHRVVETVSQSG